jgi:hypothetical protein
MVAIIPIRTRHPNMVASCGSPSRKRHRTTPGTLEASSVEGYRKSAAPAVASLCRARIGRNYMNSDMRLPLYQRLRDALATAVAHGLSRFG